MVNFDFKQDFDLNSARLINFLHLDYEQQEMIRTWRNSEKIRKWMYTDHIISKDEHQKFLKGLENRNNSFYWLVRMWDNYIGVIDLLRVSFRNKNAYFGIYANPDSKIPQIGRMLDTLAVKLVFECAGFHSLGLEVMQDNKYVINLHEEMGFVEEGKLKDFVLKDNTWKDVIVMAKINTGK